MVKAALNADDDNTPLTGLAPAKINLALHVTGRRPDNYHDIDTLVMFADLGDMLTVAPGDSITIDISGPFADHVPAGSENLVAAAAKLLREKAGIGSGVRISLVKNLPAGAGIGGGSSDAATALKLLNRLWDTGFQLKDLMEIGGSLGADIPMCLHARALRARKTGDSLTDWPDTPALPMIIAWPACSVETGSVFAANRHAESPPIPDPDSGAANSVSGLVQYLAGTRNDLTEAACAIESTIEDVLNALQSQPQCLLSRMTGSGSACFGIFPTLSAADAAERSLSAARPGWWVRALTAG